MIGRLSVLALVPARKGSKGISGKNHREVGGRSLLERSIACGIDAETVDRVVLSSNDSQAVAVALAMGCDVPFVRPEALASDTASSVDVLRHAVGEIDTPYDLVVVLQPTSPLRMPEDVDAAVRLCVADNAPACVSVVACSKPPQWTYGVNARRQLLPVLPDQDPGSRRQDLSPAYALNGAVFVIRTDWLMAGGGFFAPETIAYEMPKGRSVDVDDEIDLVIAEALVGVGGAEKKAQRVA